MLSQVVTTVFIKIDGSLWAMGENGYGQLGDGTITQRSSPVKVVSSGVIEIAAGKYHSLFLKSDGSLWAMGKNNYGQLGDGTTTQDFPVQILSSDVAQIVASSSTVFSSSQTVHFGLLVGITTVN